MSLLLLAVLLPLSMALPREREDITFTSTLSVAHTVVPLAATLPPITNLPIASTSALRSSPTVRFLDVARRNGDPASPCEGRHCPQGNGSKLSIIAAPHRAMEKRVKRQIRGPGRASLRNPYASPREELERRRAEYERTYAQYPRGGGQRDIDYADDYPPPARQSYRPYAADAGATPYADPYPRYRSYAGDADAPPPPRAAPPTAYVDYRSRASPRDDPYAYEAYPASAHPRFRGAYGPEAPRAGDPYAYADYYPPPPARPRFRSYASEAADPAQSLAGDPYPYPDDYPSAPARPRFRSYGGEAVEPPPPSARDPYRYQEEYQPPARPRFRSYGSEAADTAQPIAGDPYPYPEEYLPPTSLALPKRG